MVLHLLGQSLKFYQKKKIRCELVMCMVCLLTIKLFPSQTTLFPQKNESPCESKFDISAYQGKKFKNSMPCKIIKFNGHRPRD